jgi:hypothetical protein
VNQQTSAAKSAVLRRKLKLREEPEECSEDSLRSRGRRRLTRRSTRLATTHHSFLSSFSAVSKRNFATKYAFFQRFRDLQNYLADFLKMLQNFAKND